MPSGIKIVAETEGIGARAEKGDTLTFDCSASLNKDTVVHERRTERLLLGARNAIAGIEYALAGMREGGYRKVRISPHLAYRGEGVDSKVPANAVLIYELWLTSVDKPSAGARKLVRVLALASLIALLGPAADAFAQGKAVEPSCTAGPYRLKLPKSYKALRGIGTLRRERVQNAGDGMEERELRFNGLEIVVLAQAGKSDYVVQKAIVTTANWRIAGPLRVGSAARIALKDLKRSALPADGELEFSGDKDSIRVSLARGRVLDFEYSCSAS